MNDLSIFNNKPSYLANITKPSAEEFAPGISTGIALPFLSIRGKRFRIRKGGQEVVLSGDKLLVALIAARPTISKRYFGDPYSTGGDAPTCHSADGKTPDVANPISPSCTNCSFNVWGSATSKSGRKSKRCQDYKRLIVAVKSREGFSPLVFDLPPTSIVGVKGAKDENAGSYANFIAMLTTAGIPPTTVLATMRFADAEYPQVAFEVTRYLTEEEYTEASKLRESDDVAEALSIGPRPQQPQQPQQPEPEQPEPEQPEEEEGEINVSDSELLKALEEMLSE